MAKESMVSIITPCYNSAKFINKLFDSVLNQTYSNIEFIVVNDGSVDNTEEVILSYSERFEKSGIKFIYIKKENGGVASAINRGLEIFSGEYVTWPDSDDWMTPDCIEKKVNALQNNPECGVVIGKLDLYIEENGKHIGSIKFKDTKKRNIFDELINENGIYVAPIGWMAKSSALLETCPNRKIDDSNRMGQNWQLMLPLCYSYPCVFIDDTVGGYLIRSNSLSHAEKTLEDRYEKENQFLELKVNALKSITKMNELDKEKYHSMILQKYARMKLMLAVKLKNKNYVKMAYGDIEANGKVAFSDKVLYLRGKSKGFDLVCKVLCLPRRAFRSLVRRVKQR